MDGINRRLDNMEEKFSEFEDIVIETIQTEMLREKKLIKWTEYQLWYKLKLPNIQVVAVSGRWGE